MQTYTVFRRLLTTTFFAHGLLAAIAMLNGVGSRTAFAGGEPPKESPAIAEMSLVNSSSSASAAAPTVIIPPGRPDWIAEAKASSTGRDWAAVVAGPCQTVAECQQELPAAVKVAADEYINSYLHSKVAARLLNYSGEQLQRELCTSSDLYPETIQVSFGPMEQLHARLNFSDSFRRQLDARWRQVTRVSRLGQLGLLSAVVLTLLGTTFGFFKLSTAPRRSGRPNLQLAAGATILVVVVAGVAAARYLVWL